MYHYNAGNNVVTAEENAEGAAYSLNLSGEPEVNAYMYIHADTGAESQAIGFDLNTHPDARIQMRVRQYTGSGDEYYDAVPWTGVESAGAQSLLVPINKAAVAAGGKTMLELKAVRFGGGNFADGTVIQLVNPWIWVTTWTPETRIATICDEKDNYRFGFNGQEKDNEAKGIGNSLDFGARIYDSRLGRWLALDPLAVKYPGMSPYSFAGNSPIVAMDPDGKEIKIAHNPIKDQNGTVIKIEVNINITGKILNNSHSNVNPTDVANFVNAELVRLMNDKRIIAGGNGVPAMVTKITSSITVANTMDDVSPSDHLIAIVDDVEGSSKYGENIGVAQLGGKIAYAEVMETGGGGCSNAKPDANAIGRIAVHEILHNFGLDDEYTKSDPLPYNYMLGGAKSENSQITTDQISTIIYSDHNQGSNSSNAKDVKDKNWHDTSNSDPRHAETQGKDGKIPAIVADPN